MTQREETKRINAAIVALARDGNFRLVLREYLAAVGVFDNYGMARNPHTTNALTTAHECGRLAAAQEFVALFSRLIPDFYPKLLEEQNAAESQRLAAAATDEPEQG